MAIGYWLWIIGYLLFVIGYLLFVISIPAALERSARRLSKSA